MANQIYFLEGVKDNKVTYPVLTSLELGNVFRATDRLIKEKVESGLTVFLYNWYHSNDNNYHTLNLIFKDVNKNSQFLTFNIYLIDLI